MQLTADLFGRKIARPSHFDMSALGAAFMAGLGVGKRISIHQNHLFTFKQFITAKHAFTDKPMLYPPCCGFPSVTFSEITRRVLLTCTGNVTIVLPFTLPLLACHAYSLAIMNQLCRLLEKSGGIEEAAYCRSPLPAPERASGRCQPLHAHPPELGESSGALYALVQQVLMVDFYGFRNSQSDHRLESCMICYLRSFSAN